MKDYLRRLVVDTFRASESESAAYVRKSAGRPDGKVILVCLYVPLAMMTLQYFKRVPFTAGFLRDVGAPGLAGLLESAVLVWPRARLWAMAWWVGLAAVVYLLAPMALIGLVLRDEFSSFGLRAKGALKDAKLCAGIFCLMIPAIWFFSGKNGFQSQYPFYRLRPGEGLLPDFAICECLYLFQFFCLEFFYRGFMVHGLKERFGFYSVFVMTIPYCSIHFGKPLPESIGAIAAGILLGALSLRSGSILPGVAVHGAVALLMDIFALWRSH